MDVAGDSYLFTGGQKLRHVLSRARPAACRARHACAGSKGEGGYCGCFHPLLPQIIYYCVRVCGEDPSAAQRINAVHTSNDLESVKVCSFSDLAHHNTEQVWLIRNAAQVQRRSEGRREHTGSCDTTVPLSKGEKQQLQTLPFSVFFSLIIICFICFYAQRFLTWL